MSLITCPKCGKENVSSTAQWCPECGFHINSYLYQQEQLRRIEKVEEEPLKQLEESQDSKKINKEAKEYFKTELCKYILMLIISSALSAVFITLICNAVKFMSFDYFLQEGFWFLCFIATTLFTLYLFIYACICLKETINQRKNKIDFYLKKITAESKRRRRRLLKILCRTIQEKKECAATAAATFPQNLKQAVFAPNAE